MTPLDEPCEVCKAQPGQKCHSITGRDLGRDFHLGRTEVAYCNRCGRAAPVNHDCGRNK